MEWTCRAFSISGRWRRHDDQSDRRGVWAHRYEIGAGRAGGVGLWPLLSHDYTLSFAGREQKLADKPFPHLNDTADFQRMMKWRRLASALPWLFGLLFLGIGIYLTVVLAR